MEVPPALDAIRKRKVMYVGNEEPTARLLGIRLANCAMTSGATRLELCVFAHGWMAVSADADWITPNLPAGRSLDRAFKAMIIMRGGMQGEVRFEVIVAAFSSNVSVKLGEHWNNIIGDLPPPEVKECITRGFAVVFQAATGY